MDPVHFYLFLAFGAGIIARWGDRISFVVSGVADRTLAGFVQNNWARLAMRALVALWIFSMLIRSGEVTTELQAFTTAISFDVIMESFLDRAKKGGEAIVSKIKNGGTT